MPWCQLRWPGATVSKASAGSWPKWRRRIASVSVPAHLGKCSQMKPGPTITALSARHGDGGDAVHVAAQHLRDQDRAVGLLVVLHHRDQRAADRDAGAVQRVDMGDLAVGVTEAGVHPPCLEGPRVRAGGDL